MITTWQETSPSAALKYITDQFSSCNFPPIFSYWLYHSLISPALQAPIIWHIQILKPLQSATLLFGPPQKIYITIIHNITVKLPKIGGFALARFSKSLEETSADSSLSIYKGIPLRSSPILYFYWALASQIGITHMYRRGRYGYCVSYFQGF